MQTAYELGYRIQPINQLTLDLTGFYNVYDDLRSLEPLSPGRITRLRAASKLFGETYGTEVAATAQLTKQWRVQGNYSYFQAELHRDDDSYDTATEATDEGSSPHNQFSIQSFVDLGWNIQFDSTLRYVDSLAAPRIPSYLTLNLRLAWSQRKNLELAIVGRNLLDDHHPEFAPTFVGTQKSEVERSVYGTVVWRY